MKFSQKQIQAIDKASNFIYKNLNSTNVFKLGGYAGTGKTTIARKIVDSLHCTSGYQVLACTFTGKAAKRLTEKGLPANTIHSLIYDYDKDEEEFFLKGSNEIAGDYFLIDEASMVSEELWNDLKTFNKPFITIGDPAQLEPVGKDIFLMHNPDFLLTEIFRQEDGNGIIDFATDVRKGKFDTRKKYNDVLITNQEIPDNVLLEADIVLCFNNKLRVQLNNKIRSLRGIYSNHPVEKDQIIILKNNREFDVRNGEIYTVESISDMSDKYIWVKVEGKSRLLPLLREQFGNINTVYGDYFEDIWADYGYCLTTHKAQGSEWNNVVVYDCGKSASNFMDVTRWRYTAITRACEKLIYVV